MYLRGAVANEVHEEGHGAEGLHPSAMFDGAPRVLLLCQPSLVCLLVLRRYGLDGCGGGSGRMPHRQAFGRHGGVHVGGGTRVGTGARKESEQDLEAEASRRRRATAFRRSTGGGVPSVQSGRRRSAY
jgi:hypothetical protein